MNLAIRGWDRLAEWLEPKAEGTILREHIITGEELQCSTCEYLFDRPARVCEFMHDTEASRYFHLKKECFNGTGYDYSRYTLLQDSARPLTNIILTVALVSAAIAGISCLKTDLFIIKIGIPYLLVLRNAQTIYTNLQKLAFQKNRVVRLTPSPIIATKGSIRDAVRITLYLAASIALACFAIYNFNRMPDIRLARKLSILPSILGSAVYCSIAQKTFYATYLPDVSLRDDVPPIDSRDEPQ